MRIAFVIAFMSIFLNGCSENELANNFGGDISYELKCNQQLVNVTWKNHDLWILTKKADADFTPQSYTFSQKSQYGFFGGNVTITESSCQ